MVSRSESAPHDRTPGTSEEATFGDLLNELTLDSHWRHGRRHPKAEQPERHGKPTGHAPTPMNGSQMPGSAHHDPDDDDEAAPEAVRPYAWTRGRTTTRYRLEIETLLSTTDRYREHDGSTPSEWHSVAALCHQPTSVAEIAALLRLPLGIAKVLTGDMAAIGLLAVHETASVDGESPDLVLMERILSGLRRL